MNLLNLTNAEACQVRDFAFESARSKMRWAVQSSKNDQEFNRKVLALRSEAVFVLATVADNWTAQMEASLDQSMFVLFDDIRAVCELMQNPDAFKKEIHVINKETN